VDSYTDLSIKLAGNRPPAFVQFKDADEMNQYQFDGKNFTVLMPLAEQEDWKNMEGWHAGFHGENLSTLYFYKYGAYHIEFYSFLHKWTDKDKELANGNEEFFKKKEDAYFQREKAAYLREEKQRIKYKRDFNRRAGNYEILAVSKHIEHHGKENYQCLVNETVRQYTNAKNKYYSCYKFNSERTKVKGVEIKLIYTNPSLKETCPSWIKKQCDPESKAFNAEKLCEQAKQTCSEENIKKTEQLSKEYTYEDLQNRAKRVLDSLYIKDGWEK
jgi:hypothetical protein